MKFLTTAVSAFIGFAGAASSQSCHGICSPSNADMQVMKFGYGVQNLLYQYYKSVSVNQTYFSSLPDENTNYLGNAKGLQRQAWLGNQALKQFGQNDIMSWPMCNYKLPTPMSAKEHLMIAFHMEATLCGTFIGLGDYVQAPEAAFLMARLAAEHGIHASYIGSHLMPQIFMANSSSLTPAFTPKHVLMSGMKVGHLGQWMDNCVSAPSAPCGNMVVIGDLGSNVTGSESGNMGDMSSPSSSGGAMPSESGNMGGMNSPSSSGGAMPSESGNMGGMNSPSSSGGAMPPVITGGAGKTVSNIAGALGSSIMAAAFAI